MKIFPSQEENKMKVCPRCKKQSLTEADESEVFGVSKQRMYVYRSIHKGIKCLICGFSDARFGLNEEKDTDKKKGKS